MRKMMLLAGAAVLAASLPTLADAQGNGRGNGRGGEQAGQGNGRGGGQEARGNRGGGGQEARGRGGRQDRPDRDAERGQRRAERNVERGTERRAHKQLDRQAQRREQRRERHVERRVDRQQDHAERDLRRQPRDGRHVERDLRRGAGDLERRRRDLHVERVPDEFRARDGNYRERHAYWREGRPLPVTVARGNCPPGLARQNAFCMPPGQLRRAQMIGRQVPFATQSYNIPERYRYRFQDNDRHYYRYGDDGYVYRLDQGRNQVSQVIPLYATQMLVGEPMPLGYEVYNLPLQYRGQYRDGDEHLYRYDDNAIYRVNGRSGIVEAIVALLTGGGGGLGGLAGGVGGALGGLGGLGVGQMLPSGYDAYNLPMEYRDRYADSDDHLYRYADNNIYQVDPQSRLIEQVISLLG